MTVAETDRAAFAERMRLQLSARYHAARVEVDPERFALHVTASGLDVRLPLAPLQHACERDPGSAPFRIAEYVASVEQQLTPRSEDALSVARLLWCVRSVEYLSGLSRAADLLRAEVGAGMTAFVAEELPGSIMRGVPRERWAAAGLGDSDLRASVDANTARRFASLVERIHRAARIPADGWRMAFDPLFAGSVLMVPAVLAALVERSGGDVLLAVPDRSLVLALPAALPSAERFARRVLREWREAMNPCSRDLLITDGASLRTVGRGSRRPGTMVLPWLAE